MKYPNQIQSTENSILETPYPSEPKPQNIPMKRGYNYSPRKNEPKPSYSPATRSKLSNSTPNPLINSHGYYYVNYRLC